MKKILIAIPTAKYIESETFKSIYDLDVPEGYEVSFQYFYGYQIDQVRNLIASWAVKYDYLFSVDSDIVLPKDSLRKLLAANVDVISGVYVQRIPGEQNIEIYGFHPSGATPRLKYEQIAGGIHNVAGVGMGCCLIKSDVFRTLQYPWFEYHSALDHANTLSEDVDFCNKARVAGFNIFVDATIICDHIGATTFRLTPMIPKEDESVKVAKRLEELSNQPLLPQKHIDHLYKMYAEGVQPKVIYDVGSCVLHWTNPAKKVWPKGRFICFEAMREVMPLYAAQGVEGYSAVLSDEDGKEIAFFENLEHPGGNSYYRENKAHNPEVDQYFNDSHRRARVTRTLDSLAAQHDLPLPDLIKMDIQGAELDALKGAKMVLQQAKWLILELQHVEYNKGAPNWQEVVTYLDSQGFDLVEKFVETNVDGDYYFRRR
jgi:FkbM family methyltransferase